MTEYHFASALLDGYFGEAAARLSTSSSLMWLGGNA